MPLSYSISGIFTGINLLGAIGVGCLLNAPELVEALTSLSLIPFSLNVKFVRFVGVFLLFVTSIGYVFIIYSLFKNYWTSHWMILGIRIIALGGIIAILLTNIIDRSYPVQPLPLSKISESFPLVIDPPAQDPYHLKVRALVAQKYNYIHLCGDESINEKNGLRIVYRTAHMLNIRNSQPDKAIKGLRLAMYNFSTQEKVIIPAYGYKDNELTLQPDASVQFPIAYQFSLTPKVCPDLSWERGKGGVDELPDSYLLDHTYYHLKQGEKFYGYEGEVSPFGNLCTGKFIEIGSCSPINQIGTNTQRNLSTEPLYLELGAEGMQPLYFVTYVVPDKEMGFQISATAFPWGTRPEWVNYVP